jgi:methylenetetrahydrofolate reductase (NADPH)
VQVSFEFFPPGDEKMEQTLWQSIQRLAPLRPRFVSVTYGADGSTRERTHNVVSRVVRETLLTPAAHLTCIGMDREHVLEIARSYWHTGVRHIVALRGDAPQGSTGYQPYPGGFAYAVDLVRGLRSVGDFEISVAAYPEGASGGPERVLRPGQPEGQARCRRRSRDHAVLLRAERISALSRSLRRGRHHGQPGARHPADHALSADAALRASAAARSVPDWLRLRFNGLEDDADTRRMIAAAFAIEQVEALSREGVDEFHFYTLNRADLTSRSVTPSACVRRARVTCAAGAERIREQRIRRIQAPADRSASWCSTAPWAR